MAKPSTNRAFGAPGIEPRWTRGNKDAIGTAYSTSSSIWFSLAAGIVTEVYYPTIDRPQIRDLQYLISDGRTFFHDERRHLESEVEPLSPYALGYRLTNTCVDKPYRIIKEVIADPHHPCLLVRTWLEGDEELLKELRLFALLAPHLEGGGAGNTAYLDSVAAYDVLMATQGQHLGRHWEHRCRLRNAVAGTSASATAGPTCTTTSKWIGSSTWPTTATWR